MDELIFYPTKPITGTVVLHSDGSGKQYENLVDACAAEYNINRHDLAGYITRCMAEGLQQQLDAVEMARVVPA